MSSVEPQNAQNTHNLSEDNFRTWTKKIDDAKRAGFGEGFFSAITVRLFSGSWIAGNYEEFGTQIAQKLSKGDISAAAVARLGEKTIVAVVKQMKVIREQDLKQYGRSVDLEQVDGDSTSPLGRLAATAACSSSKTQEVIKNTVRQVFVATSDVPVNTSSPPQQSLQVIHDNLTQNKVKEGPLNCISWKQSEIGSNINAYMNTKDHCKSVFEYLAVEYEESDFENMFNATNLDKLLMLQGYIDHPDNKSVINRPLEKNVNVLKSVLASKIQEKQNPNAPISENHGSHLLYKVEDFKISDEQANKIKTTKYAIPNITNQLLNRINLESDLEYNKEDNEKLDGTIRDAMSIEGGTGVVLVWLHEILQKERIIPSLHLPQLFFLALSVNDQNLSKEINRQIIGHSTRQDQGADYETEKNVFITHLIRSQNDAEIGTKCKKLLQEVWKHI